MLILPNCPPGRRSPTCICDAKVVCYRRESKYRKNTKQRASLRKPKELSQLIRRAGQNQFGLTCLGPLQA